MAARARETEVMTAIAYPSSMLGVPQATFIAMWGGGLVIGWLVNLYAHNTLSIFAAAPLILVLWIYVARRYSKNPHIENQWRTAIRLKVAKWRRKQLSYFPGRRLAPVMLPTSRGRSTWSSNWRRHA